MGNERFGRRADSTTGNLSPASASDTKAIWKRIEDILDRKVAQLGGLPGPATGELEIGYDKGYFRKHRDGVMYYTPHAGPCWVRGAILEHYQSFGADKGALGYPTTDETPTPGNLGRYNHFQKGSIYWSPATGAHEIHGMIRQHWLSLGREASWLGYPISDEQPFTEDGRVSKFQHGNIYWWPDVGAIALGEVTVRFKGLYCFGETRGAGADSPYVIIGAVTVPGAPATDILSPIYDDVDSGDSRPDDIQFYRGQPNGLVLGLALFEHDQGDPNKYREVVKGVVKEAGALVGQGCAALLGAEAAPVCERLWKSAEGVIVDGLNSALGTDDDHIAKWTCSISAKEMVTKAGAPHSHFWGIDYHHESPLLSDGDASYKAYLAIERT
ncbi:MAG TPA: hypothetical protein VGF45_16450 [Polyangia bacterium]